MCACEGARVCVCVSMCVCVCECVCVCGLCVIPECSRERYMSTGVCEKHREEDG